MRANEFSTPIRNRIMRKMGLPVMRGLFRLLGKIQVEGLDNVPKSGAYLIILNHVSIFDAPFVVSFWPKPPEVAGAIEIWNKPGQSQLVRWYGTIPVHRYNYDRTVIERILDALRSGKPVLISPEGGRSKKPGLTRAKPGLAFIQEKMNVPIVPVGVVGATTDFLRNGLKLQKPELSMRIGKPITINLEVTKGKAKREIRQRKADQIMYKLAELLPLEYQGVYAPGVLPSTE